MSGCLDDASGTWQQATPDLRTIPPEEAWVWELVVELRRGHLEQTQRIAALEAALRAVRAPTTRLRKVRVERSEGLGFDVTYENGEFRRTFDDGSGTCNSSAARLVGTSVTNGELRAILDLETNPTEPVEDEAREVVGYALVVGDGNLGATWTADGYSLESCREAAFTAARSHATYGSARPVHELLLGREVTP